MAAMLARSMRSLSIARKATVCAGRCRGSLASGSTSTTRPFSVSQPVPLDSTVTALQPDTAGVIASTSHSLSPKPSPRRPPIQTPEDFVKAITKSRRGDLSGISAALGEEGTLKDLMALNGEKLAKAGLAVKDRRYALWCLERFRQGYHPADVAYAKKPPKKYRGWGPRVQNGKRLRGTKRKNEK